jgi:hypothetical protein
MEALMRRARLRGLTLLGVALAVALTATPAGATTPAAPDGNGHPDVGILVAEWLTPGVKDRICSGTLIAPRVFLTAAHCDVSFSGVPLDQYYVSFDPVYQSGASTLYRGTFVPNPSFVDYHNAGPTGRDPHDVAIVRLDQAAPATPATLPSAGLLSSLDLSRQSFTAVGYGRTRIDRTKGPNNIVNQFARNVITQGFRNLFPAWLTLNGDPSTASNFTCYGDSGGPHFLGNSNVIAALTATGDIPCGALEVDYRLDTPSVREYLAGQGIALP